MPGGTPGLLLDFAPGGSGGGSEGLSSAAQTSFFPRGIHDRRKGSLNYKERFLQRPRSRVSGDALGRRMFAGPRP